MTEWEGEERRDKERDHDVLTRIDANLSNFMRRFDDHVEDDMGKFKRLTDDVSELKKYLFMGLGIIAFVVFIVKIKWGS